MPLFDYTQRSKKRIGSALLFILLIVPLFFFTAPKKTEAIIPLLPVADLFNAGSHALNSVLLGAIAPATVVSATNQTTLNIKEFIGKPLAIFVARQIIRGITAQTVNWVNSGFKGNPAFVTDPNQFFLNVGDTVAAKMLSENSALNKLCTPFRAQVRLALAKNYLNDQTQYACTLGTVEKNYDAFMKNFDEGGWEGWFSMTQNSQNNPFGALINAQSDLDVQIGSQNKKYDDQLNRGLGFLSFERCKKGATLTGSGQLTATPTTECEEGQVDFTKNPPQCKKYKTTVEYIDSGLGQGDCAPGDKEAVTPGSVIGTQLNKVIGSSVTQLELVNDINQIVSALMTQLFQMVVGGIGNGLKGATEKSVADNASRSLIEKMANGSPESTSEDLKNRDLVASSTPVELLQPVYTPPTDQEVDAQTKKYADRYNDSSTSTTPLTP